MSELPAPEAVLPHRAPFLFVDRVLRCTADEAVAERCFPASEPFFAGHFPGQPLVPGVILIEGLAQTLAYLALRQVGGGTVLLTGVEGCRIRRPVRPDETVTYAIKVDKSRMGMVVATGAVTVGDDRVLTATLKGFIERGSTPPKSG
ncbi:MAG: beta-hydroxyacyl-ACP dehydratase [Myxococcales bacterium]|nr:beta-hydroxyacyl-ACP dehydratase [Myxococcales bacterium]